MQSEIPQTTLLEAFNYFIEYEYNLEPKNNESTFMKSLIRDYLSDLYDENSCSKLLELMFQQEQIDVDFKKKVYLEELASDLSSQVVNPLFNNRSCLFTWERFFKSSKSSCCFIPYIDGGRTVVRSSLVFCNFGMSSIPKYNFMVLETREKFSSPERNPQRAYFMHRKFDFPMSCKIQATTQH